MQVPRPLAASIQHALIAPTAQTTQFTGIALAKVLAQDRTIGQNFATQFLAADVPELAKAVGLA